MSNVVEFRNTIDTITTRIADLINSVPERTNMSVVGALLIALGDFIESIECPNCRAHAVKETVRVAANIQECFGPGSSGPSDHVH